MRPATDELNSGLIVGSDDVRDLDRAVRKSYTPIEEALLKAFLPPAYMASWNVDQFAVLRGESARFIEPIRVSLMSIVQAVDGAYKGGCIMNNHRLADPFCGDTCHRTMPPCPSRKQTLVIPTIQYK
jgi:hypothetical protein